MRGWVLGFRAWVRDRQLAGDNRAGSWARAEARRRQLQFVRDSWRWLAVTVVFGVAVIAGVAYLAPAGFWRGVVVGVLGATFVAVFFVLLIEVTGVAAVYMGSTAERWTASELRSLRAHGWVLVNRFLLARGGDIDHLLIGPGGVIVAETKWRSSGWNPQPTEPEFREAMEQVSRSARRLRNWDPVKKAGCPVRPVLFLWGRSAEGPDKAGGEYRVLDDVTVIHGTRAAAHWRRRVVEMEEVLAEPVAAALTTEIREHLAKRDESEAARQPEPPTLQRVFWTLFGGLVVGIAGMLAMLEPLGHGLYWAAVLVAALAVPLGIYARRFRVLRLVADAWLAGVVGVGALTFVVIVMSSLS